MEEIQSPDRRMVHVWAIRSGLAALLLWLSFSVLFLLIAFVDPSFPLMGIAVATVAGSILIMVIAYGWASLYRRFYRWELLEDEMRVWRGVLFRRRVTIPYMRIQNVNVVRGPLMLLLGLSSVQVETAGKAGGTPYGPFTPEGYLPGVVGGESLADQIIAMVRGKKSREGL